MKPVFTVEAIFSNPKLAGALPIHPKFSPDGTRIAFLKPANAKTSRLSLWEMKLKKDAHPQILADVDQIFGAEETLTKEEKSRRERMRNFESGIVDFFWSPDGKALALPISGEIHLLDLANLKARQLVGGGVIDARFSCTGKFISFVRDQNLWIYDFSSNSERALTTEGGGDLSFGVAEFVAQEEMDRYCGYWWAPDDSKIAYCRVDESGVETILRPEIGSQGIVSVPQKYPKAGCPNAEVELWCMDITSSQKMKIPFPNDMHYLARVLWTPDSRRIAFQTQPRDQASLTLSLYDTLTGKRDTALTEKNRPWVNLHDSLKFLTDGESFLWLSERSGFQHIELRNSDGTLIRTLTSGNWVVRSIKALNESDGLVFFEATLDVTETHLYSIPLKDTQKPKRLTQESGTHTTFFSEDTRYFVDHFSSWEQPFSTSLRYSDGSPLGWIDQNEIKGTHPLAPFKEHLTIPAHHELKSLDGLDTLHALVFSPKHRKIEKKLPALIYCYGGPHAQLVANCWNKLQPWFSYLNEHGFLVLMIDTRGSANRGIDFESRIHRRMGTLEVEDQEAAIKFLKNFPEADPARVGIFGWSYGGYLTLRCLLTKPSLFKAGVAVAPVTDWRLYDTHYTERYMDHPERYSDEYRASSCIPLAKNLRSKLLMIHGMADDNVLFAHSTNLHREFQTLGIPFETMNYPGERHSIADRRCLTHVFQTITRFFEENL